MTKIKGHEINVITIKDSFNRRALKFKNNIISNLKKIGIPDDDIIIELEPVAIKRVPASASWYFDGYYLHYSHKACIKYVENLYVVSKVIEMEVIAILNEEKTMDQFLLDFTEKHEVEEERKAARELLSVEADELDMDVISKKYKDLAKEAHPDKDGGDADRFKELNRAHKILKRELE